MIFVCMCVYVHSLKIFFLNCRKLADIISVWNFEFSLIHDMCGYLIIRTVISLFWLIVYLENSHVLRECIPLLDLKK